MLQVYKNKELVEISQTEKAKYCMIYSYVEDRTTTTNTQIRRTDGWLPERNGVGEGERGKGARVYGDRWKLDFRWGTRGSLYRS